LDEKLGGGFRSEGKAIYIFSGQTNVGKSIFIGNIAVNIANTGRTVVLISLEMSEMIYARRLGAKLTSIPMKQLSEKTDDFSFKIKAYASSNPNSRILIKEFPPSTITPRGLDAFLKSLVNKGIEIDAIVLDYINLLTTPEGNNSYEKIKYITEQVRSLTYLFNCPIITATQLTRAGFDTEDPDLTTISESIGLAATADFIASVFQQEGDNMNNRIRVGLMKNRWGTNSGTNVFGIDYTTLSIYEDEALNDEANEEVEEASRALNDGD
jgi:replicative DNA helicase